MRDYDYILARNGWRASAIAAKTLSPSGRMLVIAAKAPGTVSVEDTANTSASFLTPGVPDAANAENDVPPSMQVGATAPNLYLIYSTGQWKPLTADNGYYGDVCFDPTETRIAYRSQQGVSLPHDTAGLPIPLVPWALYVQSLQSEVRQKLFQDKPVPLLQTSEASPSGGLVGWIPDTNDLLYQSSRPACLWDVPLDGSKPRLVTSDPPTTVRYDDAHKRWNAQWINSRQHTFKNAEVSNDLRLLAQPATWRHLALSKAFYLPGFPASTQMLTYSPDRKRLTAVLFCSELPGGERAGEQLLAVLELARRQVRVLGVAPRGRFGQFGWAADGRHLLCSELVSNKPDRVYECDVDAVPAQPMDHVNWRYRKSASFVHSELHYVPST